ncbi:uncharacterized protein AMSG_09826 [Thecamonas trahens ATCC 50062]|uniref:FAD synthase n=1 Tax=Thecamonas trahens ATCC 50062 TaxID=461836 RepID=A0A0L0DR11_THETB|nr:hypothetical protein AMSG_09826 [Thecamonas trahens ATCC 50062]KNC53873.1 hypothetical protein AMSG_09826 [Thecamonas trahens ATCC 50062]|eukprot:XP_013754252.1 hypothetical protein AMSG_09826 [Thecamonas trahens ATCC 50062]
MCHYTGAFAAGAAVTDLAPAAVAADTVDEAAAESLRTVLRTSLEIIAKAYEEYGPPSPPPHAHTDDCAASSEVPGSACAASAGLDNEADLALSLSFNGGKDCTVLLALIGAVRWLAAAPRDRAGCEGEAGVGGMPSVTAIGEVNSWHSAQARHARWHAAYLKTRNPFPVVEQFIETAVVWSGIELEAVPMASREEGGMKATLERLLNGHHALKAMFMGTRRGDPYSDHLEAFTATDDGWPALMRVFPLLHWSYKHVWDFLRLFRVPYCELYDDGYTSLGDVHNTLRNPHLLSDSDSEAYLPAYALTDDSQERSGR